MKEQIPSSCPSLIHPITGSYTLLDNEGNIRIGTAEFGDAMYIDGTTGQMYLRANAIHIITDELEWNDLVFNSAAKNPTQATFTNKSTSRKATELSNYAK